MQIKQFFLGCLLFACAFMAQGQSKWLLPLNENQKPLGSGATLYFDIADAPSVCFDPTGRPLGLQNPVKKGLGFQLFLVEKNGLKGVEEAGKGLVIPIAYQEITNYGRHFFEVGIYGANMILNKKDEILIEYNFKPMIPILRGNDTLLVKFGVHPDAKAQGFLPDGTKLDEKIATALYPKDRAAVKKLSEPVELVFNENTIFKENAKVGVKSKDGQVLLPATYDEIIPGYPGFYAVRLDKQWGFLQL